MPAQFAYVKNMRANVELHWPLDELYLCSSKSYLTYAQNDLEDTLFQSQNLSQVVGVNDPKRWYKHILK